MVAKVLHRVIQPRTGLFLVAICAGALFWALKDTWYNPTVPIAWKEYWEDMMRESRNAKLEGYYTARLERSRNGTKVLKPEIVTEPSERKDKVILLWTGLDGLPQNWGVADMLIDFDDCPEYSNCVISQNRSMLNESDLIIFNDDDYYDGDLPKHRQPWQRWAMFYFEAPSRDFSGDVYRMEIKKIPDDRFNWTIGFRSDCDIFWPYKQVGLTPKQYNPNGLSDLNVLCNVKQKKKPIAWVVSICNTASNRENFVNELRKYIPVDVFGRCGNLTCPGRDSDECYTLLENDYKFYLSFENSICKDYITEKVWSPLKFRLVPITLGGGAYARYLPFNSYLDTRNFTSPKKLAEYIHYLDKNDTAYCEYMRWKVKVKGKQQYTYNPRSKCQLCKRLNEEINVHSPASSVIDMTPGPLKMFKWWVNGAECKQWTLGHTKEVDGGISQFRSMRMDCGRDDICFHDAKEWMNNTLNS